MIDVEISPYRLFPHAPPNSRTGGSALEGVLIRREGGHGCIQAWPSLGDAPLSSQLDALGNGRSTPLVDQALACAAVDAAARRAGIDLFDGLSLPPSHALLARADVGAAEKAVQDGFTAVKVKMGTEWRGEIGGLERIAAFARLRLDFNECLSESEFIEFAVRLPPGVRDALDFIEDPFPFDAEAWSRQTLMTRLPLAADRHAFAPGASAFFGILKPARDDTALALDEALANRRRLVVTTSMDHPIGQLWAAWQAAMAMPSGVLFPPCGLCSHTLFERDPFSERLAIRRAALIPPGGPGLGFGDLLDSLPWTPLPISR